MALGKVPFATPIGSRDGTFGKDGMMTNCYPEPVEGGMGVAKRPGLAVHRALATGAGSGIVYWAGNEYSVVGTTLYKDGSSLGTVNGTGGLYQFSHNLANTLLVLKNNNNMYTVNGAGTITTVTDGDYPATTVPGLVYLDGTFYVMDSGGNIYGSDIEVPTSWNALNRIVAQVNPETGVAIAKQLNYVLAFSSQSIETFYDAANASGSPLGRYEPAYIPLGCASAGSIASLGPDIFFMSQSAKRGRGIYRLSGLSPQKISTPQVDRILDADTLSTVLALCLQVEGQAWYLLTLKGSSLTLAYHIGSGTWQRWTSLSADAGKTITALSWSNNVATATIASHGLATGKILQLAGFTPAGYNGNYIATVVDANTLSFPLFTSIPVARRA